ncbi:phosphogluconate dehydratase (plasmid) [Ketogulonicigenium robustum]|uniref:Phosphogluconate dehydratase n=1 Tax=Ketogulonicigenium robustum TaxID=92947 RepID=A0A1W6P322_9RHOB|nr:phosphogluconate dehydratase [Ketogulonicigenium robustum]ARO15876.1 phosphogluconate dehydratase [Ketogulonicigenium robustum]
MPHSPINAVVAEVTERIRRRSEQTRGAYLDRIRAAVAAGPSRSHLGCGNQAHAYAAMGQDKASLVAGRAPNIGIITAYNDMLSAHQPFETYPQRIRDVARSVGATAQVAGGVPAMCDGITQGQAGMELSLFSRDVIAMAAAVGLSHNCFDASIYLGVCDKIVPGLIMAAASFGHIPAVFVPAGPMASGITNSEKAAVRNAYAEGKATREELMAAEMASYHGPGTCTFYGTANSNQMLMEVMGLHLPGATFIHPGSPLREALTDAAVRRAAAITALGNDFCPAGEILDERAYVNGIVGLMATGGSTNLVLHLPAMARASGILLDLQDFDDLASVVPLMARVYPNGLADVNHFHAAGGLQFLIGELLDAGLLHADAQTIMGTGLAAYRTEPKLHDGAVTWQEGPTTTLNDKILRPVAEPFAATGGLRQLHGNLGRGVIKVSAVAPERHIIQAPARVFIDQHDVKAAFQRGEFTSDTVVVLRFQGPSANGMPELHTLTPVLSVLQDRGLKVALVTDGRMSGASGKVPAAIHVAPEAAAGGPLALIEDGDMIRLDAVSGTIDCLSDLTGRRPAQPDLSANATGMGRELFATFRNSVGTAETGASALV